MHVNKIEPEVLECLRQRGHDDDRIAQMSPDEAFIEYCECHGLIGWGVTLTKVMRSLRLAEGQVVHSGGVEVVVSTRFVSGGSASSSDVVSHHDRIGGEDDKNN
jgi:hypothetical protein